MTAHVRTPYCQVLIDDQPVTNVLSASGSLDYGQRIGQATISVPFTPAWAGFRSKVEIRVGGDISTAVVRFAGFILRFSAHASPMTTDIVCKGWLYFATTDMNNDPAGIDLSGAGAGQTDQAIVAFLLHEAGLDAFVGSLGGTGKTLGTVATDQYRWAFGQSALDCIDQFDTVCLGYRTFETFGGTIIRTQITAAPGATAAATFTEGVDMEAESTSDATIENIKNQVQVTGYTDNTGAQFNYTLFQANPNIPDGADTQQLSSPLLESSNTGGAGLSCQEVAEYLLPVVNRGLETVLCQTPRDDVIGPGMTIAIDAVGRLGVRQNLWVQGMAWNYTDKGSFFQQLTCLGYALGTGGTGTTSGGSDQGGTGGDGNNNPPDGGGGDGGSGGGSNPPVAGVPTVDFTILVEQERVIVAGVEADLYLVSCTSAVTPGTGAINSYAWSTSGGSPHPASGTDPDFATSYAAIATQTITLTVTDANGNTGVATHTIPAASGAGYVRRRIFLAGTSTIDDFDGATWRVHANSALVTTNGPIWAEGAHVLTSTDDLASAPTSVDPFLSGTVTALWFEGDASPLNVLAGSSNGAIARSGDGGLAWTIANAAPSAGNAVLRCVWSRFVRGQLFALTAGGLFRSDNYGAGWVTVLAAAGGETFRDVAVGPVRIMIAMSGGRLVCDQAGTAQTMPANSGDIVAIAPHIRKDAFYAYDSAGHTFAHANSGDTTMAARVDLPAGGATRGLWRDSQIVDLLYVAAGAAYKSVDGFRSSGGYFQIRAAGVGTSPGGASYVQIGTDGILRQIAVGDHVFASQHGAGNGKCWVVGIDGAEPAGWQQPTFNDTGWFDTVQVPNIAEPFAISAAEWVDRAYPVMRAVGVVELYRSGTSFNLPTGRLSTATLEFGVDDFLLGIWINGTFVDGSAFNGNPLVSRTISIPPSLLRQGAANILAFKAQNTVLNTGMGVVWKLTVA